MLLSPPAKLEIESRMGARAATKATRIISADTEMHDTTERDARFRCIESGTKMRRLVTTRMASEEPNQPS